MILSYDMILENLPRTSRQTHKQTNRQRIQLQRPLLSPVDRRGERANNLIISDEARDNEYSCEQCDYTTTIIEYLTQHINSKHQGMGIVR